jgi:hypothetical protein
VSQNNHAPKAELDIAGMPVTVRGQSVNDNEAAARARIEHEVDPRDGVAVMAVSIVVLVVITMLVLTGCWPP